MFAVSVNDTAEIVVSGKTKSMRFALDASGMNPLEAFYATLAGCAAVYAKKACKELGISAEGISVKCRPMAGKAGPLSLGRFETELTFGIGFTDVQVEKITEAVQHCAVKEVVKAGATVEFVVSVARA